MSALASSLELLPTELLDQIISYLSTEPPSFGQVHRTPSLELTQSPTKDLKNLGQCSRRLFQLVRPVLFTYVRLDLHDELDFHSFMVKSDLCQNVMSLVVLVDKTQDHEVIEDRQVDPFWWRRVLRYLDPRRVLVVGPPLFIGNTLASPINDGHLWAFDMPLQILLLERECKPRHPSQLPDFQNSTSLLASRPWTSMTFNEASSLKSYNHYEYFLSCVPSVLAEWGTSGPRGPTSSLQRPIDLPTLLCGLEHFSYTAVFPFFNHSQVVLDAIARMHRLRRLDVRLAPLQDNRITELEQRGPMDPNDPWMELTTSYSLIGYTMNKMPDLKEFRSGDLHVEAIRQDLLAVLDDAIGDEGWVHDGQGGAMASAPNVYSAEPAFPVLADSLLRRASTENTALSNEKTAKNDWNLKNDWKEGIQSSKESVFRCGVVLGFSRLRMRSNESNEYIGQIPRCILTNHLRSLHPSSEPSAFIIHPQSFEAFAPRTLLNELQSSSHDHPGLSRDDAIHRLDSVQLLPIHNFPNAAQAISKVSEALHEIQEKREQRKPTEESPSPHNPIVLIVVGLDTLAEGIIRASNPARGTAVLTATLRTLTRLSRVHASHLSIILVNTNGLGWDIHQSSAGNTTEDNAARQPLEDGIHSIFHSDIPSLFPTLLMKTLDQGIDTHLLLSDLRGAQIVEVIKDRVGTSLGKWGIWNEQ
ncbi:uncharacterized protein PGRI_026420 [Penicillium griseofulvum]|uniref:F-box domain-containing protein n=1 Tax=Penicillium patulum TaxID=5078 RepID=A0A135LIH8_PENPA|nr:uncharacterized protein PGRI_026420 [Penicillium griseofulvum]KXG48772.1 hypothetical protein PGRI_026420 [Penicillium griseofulvum]